MVLENEGRAQPVNFVACGKQDSDYSDMRYSDQRTASADQYNILSFDIVPVDLRLSA